MNICQLEDLFDIPKEKVLELGFAFRDEMIESLEKQGSLKMLKSFLGVPKGNEQGEYIAVDFGGTNLRVFLIELKNNSYNILKKYSYTFVSDEYDYKSHQTDEIMMFNFIADKIGLIIENNKKYYLGHTFSFGTTQKSINEAILIKWSKEFRTRGVEGNDINKLLIEALQRKNIYNVFPIAIVNDTVTTLLTGALTYSDCSIGTICGTGHNTCYLEKNTKYVPYDMIINLESGNFNKVSATVYDEILDCDSAKPGEQRLEKMVSGNYLGKLFGIVVNDLINKDILNISNFDYKAFKTSYITRILEEDSKQTMEYIKTNIDITDINDNDYDILKQVGKLIITRAAKIAAATYVGILNYIDEDLENTHTIAMDGSLYKRNKLFRTVIDETFNLVYNEKSKNVKIVTVEDASGIGAAIAGAIAKNMIN